jgi:hypothetical protein
MIEAYIARACCGCVTAVSIEPAPADPESWREELAAAVGAWIRAGFMVERVSVGEARSALGLCASHAAAPTTPLEAELVEQLLAGDPIDCPPERWWHGVRQACLALHVNWSCHGDRYRHLVARVEQELKDLDARYWNDQPGTTSRREVNA